MDFFTCLKKNQSSFSSGRDTAKCHHEFVEFVIIVASKE